MKKLFRKPLALVIALAIILTSLSIAVSATPDYTGNYTVKTKIEGSDDSGVKVIKKGDAVIADVFLGTDFIASGIALYFTYDSNVLALDPEIYDPRSRGLIDKFIAQTTSTLPIEDSDFSKDYDGSMNNGAGARSALGITDANKASLRVMFTTGTAEKLDITKVFFKVYFVAKEDVKATDVGTFAFVDASLNISGGSSINYVIDETKNGAAWSDLTNGTDFYASSSEKVGITLKSEPTSVIFSGDVKLDCAGGTITGMTADKDTTDKYTLKGFNGEAFDTKQILASPAKADGSEFIGWTLSTDTAETKTVYKTADLPGTIKYANGNDTVTLTAVYKGVGSIKIDAKGGTIAGMTPDTSTTDKYTITGPEGDPIDTSKILADPDKGDGSKFLGWTYGSVTTPVKTTDLPNTIKFATSGVVTLTAVYQEVGSIKIDANGGTIAGMTPDTSTTDKYTITGLDGESIDKTQILADPAKSNADFIGWTYGTVTTPVLTANLPTSVKYGLNENVITLKANYREVGKIKVSAGAGKLKFGSTATELTSIDFIGYTDEAFTLDSVVNYSGKDYKLSEITAIPSDNSKEFSKWVIPSNLKYGAETPVEPEYVGAATTFKIEIYEQSVDGTYPAPAAKTAIISVDGESKPYRAGMKITLTAEQAAALASYTPGDNFKAIGNASITPATETELVATAASNVFKVEVPRKTVSKVEWKIGDDVVKSTTLSPEVRVGTTFNSDIDTAPTGNDYYTYKFENLPATVTPDSGSSTMTITGTKTGKDVTINYTATVKDSKTNNVTITFAPADAQVTKYGVIGAIAKTASAPAGYNVTGYTYENGTGADATLNNAATLPAITTDNYTITNNEGALSITLTPVITEKTDVTVTAKFKNVNGEVSTVKTYSNLVYNASFEMPAMTTYEKDGYSYAWDTTLTTVPAVDTTVTYVETAKKVDVKFAGTSAGQVDFNKAIPTASIPVIPTAQGKTPDSWALEIDGAKYTYDFTKTIEQNIKALSKAYSSTINFVPVYSSTDHFYIVTGYNNGFIWEEKTEFAKTWIQDTVATPYTVPTIPVMEGYVVNGWKLEKTGENLGATNTNAETDRNYYAMYDIKQFDVIFQNEDGTSYENGTYDKRGVKFGEQFPAVPGVQPADKSEKEVFNQWVDQNGNPYGTFSTMPDIGNTGAQLIFKPTYQTIEIPYTWMSTDTFGKEYQFAVTTNTANTPVVYPESEPTKFGMKFVGWADENGQAPDELAGAEEKTYYAQFEVDKTFVAVVVGGAVVSGTVIATAAAANAALITGAAIGTAVIGGVVIAKHTYTVTYMVDGEVYKTYKILEGTKVFTPKDPVKDGSVFKGWDNLPEKMPANDITVNAVWGAADENIIPDTGSSSASIAAFAAISGAAAAAYVISRRKKEN